MSQNNKCPACGAAGRTEENTVSRQCPLCGFPYPAPAAFLSRNARDCWAEAARAWSENALRNCHKEISASGLFTVNRSGVFLADPTTRKLLSSADSSFARDNVVSVSTTSRQGVICFGDGHLEMFGNDVQALGMQVRGLHEIRTAVVSPDCLYAVSITGNVIACGSTYEREVIESWTGVKSLSACEKHIAGLLENGKVVYAVLAAYRDGSLNPATEWSDIKQIATAAGCILGLQEGGSVFFAGETEDPRKAICNHGNIVQIAADDTFAYALDTTGRVHLEGDKSTTLGRDRLKIEELEHVVMICAYKAAAAALLLNGEIRIFGSVSPMAMPDDSDRTINLSGLMATPYPSV